MRFTDKLVVPPRKRLTLAAWDADETLGFKEGARAETLTRKAIARLDELQNVLWAEKRRALLIVLQAMDAGGKDGTIRHVMSGVNPQGCRVTSFKRPTEMELNHDFLWRVHQAVPAKGEIGIFNRSHYEDVLVARVHKLVPEAIWSKRFDQINDFERLLKENQVTTLKFFLHIGKDEQRKRLQKRLRDPAKQWKLQPADFEERKYWRAYMEAYEDVLIRCSTAEVPWFVIPANKKWFRNLAVSSILAETLEAMKLKFPRPSLDLAGVSPFDQGKHA
jgi:PPK2 family polyphosphate:nucleotide phosphotransferase